MQTKISFHCVWLLLLLLLLLLLSSSSSSSPVTRPFSPAHLPLNQLRSPPLTLQVSACSTFRIMCDVPSTVVLCSESIEWFPDVSSKFFLKPPVTIPVAPVTTSIILHFMFYIRCILYLFSRLLPFQVTFLSTGMVTSISVHSLLLLYDMDVSCHRPFLPGTSLEPAVIPTAQALSFTLQYFPYYVWFSKYSCLL